MSRKRFFRVLSVLVFSVWALMASVGAACAADKVPAKGMPLPSGLSKDAQFIIFYVDKRFDAVQREMDKRFDAMQREMDKRFEQVDKRFEQVDKRFDMLAGQIKQIYTFIWITVTTFAGLVAAIIGFAIWDRRTMLREARRQIESEGRLKDLIRAMRELAKNNQEVANALRSFNLL